MTELWLVRYSEIFLKSDPVRREWEKALTRNIRGGARRVPGAVRAGEDLGRGPGGQGSARRVFGIVSFSPVTWCSLGDLNETLLGLCRRNGATVTRILRSSG